jgi:general secretion pathway protein G
MRARPEENEGPGTGVPEMQLTRRKGGTADMKKSQGGFTLVEVIVVAGIIAILAGVLVPLILKEIDESRISRAYGDIRSISAAMMVFKKDTGKWPNLDGSGSCSPSITLLGGQGSLPASAAANGFDSSAQDAFDSYFLTDAYSCYGTRWKGPYMAMVPADPWGNLYLVNAGSFGGGAPVWVLSAGPDGDFQTTAASQALAGDDVGVRIM